MRIRMDRLGGLVLDNLSGTQFTPERLEGSPAALEKLARTGLQSRVQKFFLLHRNGVPEWSKERTGKSRFTGGLNLNE